MEADGDLVEPFDPGAPADDAGGSEAEPSQDNSQPEDAPPPPDDGGDLAQPFDDSADDGGFGGDDGGGEDDGQDQDQHEDQSLSVKANSVLNQTLYQKLVNRNQEIEDTLNNLQTITPVLPSDIIDDGKTGLLAKMEVEDLAQKMEWMISHEMERRMMGEDAYKKAAQYRKEVVMPRWEKLYKSLI